MPEWTSVDIGNVGVSGTTLAQGTSWQVSGAGADIWGREDAFRYLYRLSAGGMQQLVVRVDSLAAGDPFAKAGLMLRDGLDASASTILFNTRPGGDLEFMAEKVQGRRIATVLITRHPAEPPAAEATQGSPEPAASAE